MVVGFFATGKMRTNYSLKTLGPDRSRCRPLARGYPEIMMIIFNMKDLVDAKLATRNKRDFVLTTV